MAFPPDLPDDALGTRPYESDGPTPDRFAGHAGYFGSPSQPGYAANSDHTPASGREIALGADADSGQRSGGRHLQPEPEPLSMFTPCVGIGQHAIDAGPSDEHSTDVHADLRTPDAHPIDAVRDAGPLDAHPVDLVPLDARPLYARPLDASESPVQLVTAPA